MTRETENKKLTFLLLTKRFYILLNYFLLSMVELYCSWCKGLCESKKALGIIRDSNEFSGIELSSNISGETESIILAGLKVSIHNPSRFFKVSLESPDFIPTIAENPSIIDSCKKSSLPFVSFHAGHAFQFSKLFSKEIILSNTRKSLRFLDHELDKKILFETLPLPFKVATSFGIEKESGFYSTSIEYMKDILSSTNAGALLDVSHTLSSASSRVLSNNYNGTIKDYFVDVLNAISKNVFEMHINCPQFIKNEGFLDKHFLLKSSGVESKMVFECTQEAIEVSPNLKMITLEIEPMLEPIKHAQAMVKQAKLARKKLNL